MTWIADTTTLCVGPDAMSKAALQMRKSRSVYDEEA